MKHAILLIIAAGLTACASNTPVSTTNASAGEVAEVVKVFESVCLKTAPSFAEATQAAKNFGITDINDVGFMKMGSNKDKSLGVQISENKECVVTTSSQHNRTLTKQFLQMIGQYSSTPPANQVPMKATINDVPFIFQHDRRGGEALVMLSLK